MREVSLLEHLHSARKSARSRPVPPTPLDGTPLMYRSPYPALPVAQHKKRSPQIKFSLYVPTKSNEGGQWWTSEEASDAARSAAVQA